MSTDQKSTLDTDQRVAELRAAAIPAAPTWTARAGAALRPVAPFLTALVVWWGAWAIFRPPDIVLVSPIEVFSALLELARQGMLDAFVTVSLGRLGRGVLVGILVGIPVGWLLGLDEDIARASEPLLRFFNAVSGIAWLPLMLLWFGFGERTITAIIVYTMVFPVVFNAMLGVRTIPDRLPNACRTLGAGWLRIIRDVYVPGSFPSVMTGLRLGIGYGWRALIAGEFVVGGGGLGFLIFNARTQGNIAEVMGGMIVLGVLWVMLDRLILAPVEQNIISRWGMMRT